MSENAVRVTEEYLPYTLIFGAQLKQDVSPQIMNTLSKMMDGTLPAQEYPFECSRISQLFRVPNPNIPDDISECSLKQNAQGHWLFIRTSVPNEEKEIEQFLTWIKPSLAFGTPEDNTYAYVINEKDGSPTIYCLNNEGNKTKN